MRTTEEMIARYAGIKTDVSEPLVAAILVLASVIRDQTFETDMRDTAKAIGDLADEVRKGL